jgi:hypothetical protein
MAWQRRLYIERLLSRPGGWPTYHVLEVSCLAFPLGVICTMSRRFPARRRIAIVVAGLVLGLIQYLALDLAYPIRE